MTTILDSSVPRTDEPRGARPKTFVTPAVLVLLAAGTLTFLNLAAGVYTYRSTRTLIEIETRLGDLKDFEDRVAGQLDMMNNGIQRRLEMLQSDFQSQIGGMREETSRLVIPAPVSENAAIEIVTEMAAPDLGPMPEPGGEAPEEIEADAVPKRTTSRQAAQKSSAYERVQSRDGKVYYRKVQ